MLGSGGGAAAQQAGVKKFEFFHTQVNNVSDVK